MVTWFKRVLFSLSMMAKEKNLLKLRMERLYSKISLKLADSCIMR